jgi:hypothetical protein
MCLGCVKTVTRKKCRKSNSPPRASSSRAQHAMPRAYICSAAKRGYSITSSARARSVGGMSRPRAFAVF